MTRQTLLERNMNVAGVQSSVVVLPLFSVWRTRYNGNMCFGLFPYNFRCSSHPICIPDEDDHHNHTPTTCSPPQTNAKYPLRAARLLVICPILQLLIQPARLIVKRSPLTMQLSAQKVPR